MKHLGRFFSIINIALLVFTLFIVSLRVYAQEDPSAESASLEGSSYIHARPSTNGKLKVSGTHIVDQNGQPVILKGISTHGLTWFPQFINEEYFAQLSSEWDCNLIRLPMYSETYCRSEEPSLSLLKSGVEYAIKNDMYVIVDWHILNDHDPNINLDKAMVFFDRISAEYADVPNVIYEVCNEPNGTTDWKDVYDFCNKTVPIIRRNSPDSIILVGTPDFGRALISALRRPIPFENIMYSLHFYAASHYENLQSILLEAVEDDLPVFISECGLPEETGDGNVDYENAIVWFDMLHKNGISYTIWSFSNKSESSAMIKPDFEHKGPITDNDLTSTGLWVKDLIKGADPGSIPIRSASKEATVKYALSRIFGQPSLNSIYSWPRAALPVICFLLVASLLTALLRMMVKRKYPVYSQTKEPESFKKKRRFEKLFSVLRWIVLVLSIFFSVMYLYWRMFFSIPFEIGIFPVICNIILLIVELFGFFESLVLYSNLISIKTYPLPEIKADEYPDVDIFIATYNEPTDLLQKTINACNHLKYPDKSKVHIWVCDDNRRKEMRALAERMNVGYFDRPDNKGAKAGNLNNAMAHTSSPYIVTLDADMIVKSDFLMKTIPYFVQAKKDGVNLGLLQTPQCFYEPDIFQYSLYSEKNAPNEQDFFYRTIEVAKTSSNSVIYGGSNTILLRKALEDINGFYTGSITEDFATGLLLEAKGYVSLALPEPLASGKTPDTFKEHVKQRVRWGRGVISTAKKLHIISTPGLSIFQRLSYWSSVVFWYSPIKCLIYILSPLVFAVFGIPVFKCTFMDLLIFWLPMFIAQDMCLRAYSQNSVSLKWSGIYETSVMPFLLVPVVKEMLGMTTSTFAVTNKDKKPVQKEVDKKSMRPFIILIVLSVFGLIRMLFLINGIESLGLVILAFWIIRNLYYLIMSLFLIDGREYDADEVKVVDADLASIKDKENTVFDGITTYMTDHSISIYLDEAAPLLIGDRVDINVEHNGFSADVHGVITKVTKLRNSQSVIYSIEILDFKENENEYDQVLFDRIPSLPQSLTRDYGMFVHMAKILAHRIIE